MRYLVDFRTEGPEDVEFVAERDNVYFSPEGGRGWAILEADDEESLRRSLGGRADEVQLVLPASEYRVIHEARRELEDSKARFVDDPAGAISDARRSVGRVMEERGYSPPEREEEAPGCRREILKDYRDTDRGGSEDLEDQRDAFNRLSGILDRIARA